MSNKRRKYTNTEIALFMQLISQDRFKNVIECKKTDALSTTQKCTTWKSLTSDFNAASPEGARSVAQLQALWKNQKAKYKQSKAKERRERNQTGGGSCPCPDKSPVIALENGNFLLEFVVVHDDVGLPFVSVNLFKKLF